MAALVTLSFTNRQKLANSLEAAAAAVRKNVQCTPISYGTDVSAQLAATKVLLDAAQG